MCPSDDCTADIDNDGVSDCRDADGQSVHQIQQQVVMVVFMLVLLVSVSVMMDVLIVLMTLKMNVHSRRFCMCS